MRFSKDFRRIAWTALEKDYWFALLVSLAAAVLGGAAGSIFIFGNVLHYTFDGSSFYEILTSSPIGALFLTMLILSSGIFTLIRFLIGGAVHIGLCRYEIGLVENRREYFSTLFKGFDIFGKALGLRCFTLLFEFLWSLLFIFPGVIAALRYAMAPFIMAESPGMGIREAVAASKKMMRGNKARLFKLYLSFIGWYMLCILTLGLGQMFLSPYVKASVAAFYLEISGQGYRLEQYR